MNAAKVLIVMAGIGWLLVASFFVPAQTGRRQATADPGQVNPTDEPLPIGAIARLPGPIRKKGEKAEVFRVKSAISQVAILQRQKLIATASNATHIYVWEFPTGILKHRIKRNAPFGVTPEENLVIPGLVMGLDIWNLKERQTVGKIRGASLRGAHRIMCRPQKDLIIAGSQMVRFVDTKGGGIVHQFPVSGTYSDISLSGNGRFIAVGDNSGEILICDARTGRAHKRIPVPNAARPGYDVSSLALSHDADYLAGFGRDVFVIYLPTQEIVFRLPYAAAGPLVRLSPDDRLLVTRKTTDVDVWEMATGKRVANLRGHRDYVLCADVSANGRYLCSGAMDNSALVWDVLQAPALGGKFAKPTVKKEFRQIWENLRDGEAATAYKAIRAIVENPKEYLALLGQKLEPTAEKTSPVVSQNIDLLDDSSITKRRRARQQLEKLGGNIKAALAEAMKKHPSEKVKDAVGRILFKLPRSPITPDQLRQMRAIQALQWIGNRESVQLLEQLAQGDALDRQTQEAKVALRQLRKLSVANK